MLAVGSVAGVTLMGLEGVGFLWYAKCISPWASLGFILGLGTCALRQAIFAQVSTVSSRRRRLSGLERMELLSIAGRREQVEAPRDEGARALASAVAELKQLGRLQLDLPKNKNGAGRGGEVPGCPPCAAGARAKKSE
ncbi:nhaD, partial [Symbiodinium sp. KB8]